MSQIKLYILSTYTSAGEYEQAQAHINKELCDEGLRILDTKVGFTEDGRVRSIVIQCEPINAWGDDTPRTLGGAVMA